MKALALLCLLSLASNTISRTAIPRTLPKKTIEELSPTLLSSEKVHTMDSLIEQFGSPEEALKIILQQENLIIDFFASWCSSCKQFAPAFEKVATQQPSIIFVSIDTDKYPSISKQYGIVGIPDIRFFKNGVEIHKVKDHSTVSFNRDISTYLKK